MALGTKLPRRSVQVPCPAPYSSRRRMQSSCRPTKLSLPLLTLAPLRQLSPPSLPAGSGSLLQPHGARSLNRALTARPEHWLPRRSSHNSMCVICVIIIGCDIFSVCVCVWRTMRVIICVIILLIYVAVFMSCSSGMLSGAFNFRASVI